MYALQAIHTISRQTGCSTGQASHALAMCSGDVQAAIALIERLAPKKVTKPVPASLEVLKMHYGPETSEPADFKERIKVMRQYTGRGEELIVGALIMHDYDLGSAMDILS